MFVSIKIGALGLVILTADAIILGRHVVSKPLFQ
jgi:hypothetical protein